MLVRIKVSKRDGGNAGDAGNDMIAEQVRMKYGRTFNANIMP